MKQKKTLVIGEAFYPEDFLINDLVKEWEKENFCFEVLTRTPSYPFGKVYEGYKNKIYQTTYFNSIKIHRFPVIQGYEKSILIKVLNYLSFVFWSCWVVLFIGHKFDKVFIYQTGPLTLATAGIFLKKFYKAKVTIWTQDLWPETVYAYGFKQTRFLCFFLDCFVKWIYDNCDHIMVSCEGFIDRIHKYVPGATIEFVPNWSLVEYHPLQKQQLPGRFNFTFAGNIGKVQNLENIIRGFSVFVKDNPEVYLNIIGDGSFLPELKELVVKEGICNINFVGRVPLNEIADYYEASDVLVISLKDTPLYEITIPSKFQTYLSTKKPIYAIFKGEVKKLVEKYHIGFVAHPSDLNEIANGFKTFLNLSEEKMKDISTNSSLLLHSVFNRDSIIDKINSIFWK